MNPAADEYGPGSQFYRLPEGVKADDVMTYKGIKDEAHPDGIYTDTYDNIARQQAKMTASQQGFNGGTAPTGVTPLGQRLETPVAAPQLKQNRASVMPEGFGGGMTARGGPAQLAKPMLATAEDMRALPGASVMPPMGSGEMSAGGNMAVQALPAAGIAKAGIAAMTTPYAALASQSGQYRAAQAAAKLVANLGVAPSQAQSDPATGTNQIKSQEAAPAPSAPRFTAASGINFGNSGGSGPIQGFTPSSIKSIF